jgi:protein gp37
MSANSKIEWCDHTFNPWIGCTKVSPGCANCYAEGESKRRGWAQWGRGQPRHHTSETYWKQPIQWNRRASLSGVRERVFCASLADVFDPEVPDEWRFALFRTIIETPHLDWLLLTKRPEIAHDFYHNKIGLRDETIREKFLPNVWLGVSVEDQTRADERIPVLLEIPAVVHFLSCEPLLGPVDLAAWFCCNGKTGPCSRHRPDWIICGGESGHGARPMHPDWALSLRKQCAAAGVPFFFKQWGEFAPVAPVYTAEDWLNDGDPDRQLALENDGCIADDYQPRPELYPWIIERVGKKRAGRLLNGREWNEFPSAIQRLPRGEALRGSAFASP